ncbi:lysin A [Microbacterium phage Megan]|uniref:Lysin A n=1 Tax=Microbacterium phage Megan TaxID=2656551 RepID=A0A649VK21_9CAUD|nr:lysin A [Microbacterium phage Megan]QGJ92707.1 lysin A [Microbacterium phage Megan]
MADFVWRDGQRLTAWMLYVITLLDIDLFRIFGVHVIVSSGIRTYAEQEAIFRSRYVTAGNVNGRYVYDTRWWNGVLWYRISSAGTVAVPGTSNHEIQGSKAAVDLRDTGRDAGIATAGSARSNWLRANAGAYGLIASGFSFNEAWHYDVPNIWTPVPTPKPPAPTPEPEPEPTLEELMALKSAVIIKNVAAEGYPATALDFAEGFKTSWQADVKYSQTMGVILTEGGPVIITASHYDRIMSDFDAFFKARHERERELARLAGGTAEA